MRYTTTFLLLIGFVAPAFGAELDSQKLAQLIDKRLAKWWTTNGVKPTEKVDDATFLRRASLDLIGRIPTPSEVRDFLADPSKDKRQKLIEKLISNGGHSRHMATFWRRSWLPQTDTNEFSRYADDFEEWLAVRLQQKTPYNILINEILTFPSQPSATIKKTVNPANFFVVNENKPENLAANTSRAFLGINLDCAQCHDHPFARWTRDQFWQTAAFFMPSTIEEGKTTLSQLMIPNSNKMVSAELLDGSKIVVPEKLAPESGRIVLSNWMTDNGNPYLARNAVNRLWSHFFGLALVEPLDDLSSDAGTKGSQADLLKELADIFVKSGYDLEYLTKAITQTQAYQLSTAAGDPPASELRLFARMPMRGLTGEQLYDSIRTASGLPVERSDVGQSLAARRRFISQFYVERPIFAERSISQSLALLNGQMTNSLTDPKNNPTLAGVIDSPFLETQDKIEVLFLAVYGRKPTDRETNKITLYLEAGGSAATKKSFGDLFWSLINSTEFNTNH